MRFILLFLILFCLETFASSFSWLSKTDFLSRKSGIRSMTMYRTQLDCELANNEVCIDAGLDIRRVKIGFSTINVLQTLDCLNAADCSSKVNIDFVCADFSVAKFDDKVNWPTLDFVGAGRPATGFFLWCEKEIQEFDAAGDSAANTEDAQITQDISDRNAARGPREISLQQCVQDSKNPTLTPTQTKDCVRAIVRELLGDKVAIPDL